MPWALRHLQNYRCTEEGGAPPLNALVQVLWTDDRLWPGVFCGQKTHVQCQVVFDDGSRLSLPRSRVFGLHQQLPRRIADRLVSQSVSQSVTPADRQTVTVSLRLSVCLSALSVRPSDVHLFNYHSFILISIC